MDFEKNMQILLKQLRRMSVEEKLLWFQTSVSKNEDLLCFSVLRQYLSKFIEVNNELIDLLNKELNEEAFLKLVIIRMMQIADNEVSNLKIEK